MRFLALPMVAGLLGLVPASAAVADDLQVAADPVVPAAPTPVTPSPVVATAPPPSVATNAPRATRTPPPAAPTETRTKFYGWQNILVGELGLGAAIGGAFLGAGEPGAIGGLVYLFGGPAIHGAHGSLAKVFGSLGGNVGFPLVGALTGFAIMKGSEDEGQGAAIGVLVGCAVAPLFDGLVLGWSTPKRSDGTTGKYAPAAPPMVGVTKTKHGFTATVAGAF